MKLIYLTIFLLGCSNSKHAETTTAVQPKMIQDIINYNFPCNGNNCKTVLSIGDSISVGTNIELSKKINSSFNLFHPKENCRNSWYQSEHIDQWISEVPNPDIIIWNVGVWNVVNSTLANMPGNFPEQYGTSLEQYKSEITKIALKLKATGAKRVIFFTSTQLDPSTINYFDVDKIDQLNQVAYDTLPDLGIEVEDLHAVSMTITDQHNDGIHYNSVGWNVLADFEASIIESN